MQELSGGAPPPADGAEPQRIEGGPGGFDQGRGDSYGGDRDRPPHRDRDHDRDLKPWQRGPPTGPAPWQRPREERPRDDYRPRGDHGSAPPWAAAGRGGGGNDGYGYGSQGGAGYGGGAPGAPAPWQQHAAPPPPPGDQAGYGYGGYPAFPPQHNMGAPPGLSGPPPGMAQPMYQGYGAGSPPPPPPPPGDGPPPPVSFPIPNSFKKNLKKEHLLTLSIASERPATPASPTRLIYEALNCEGMVGLYLMGRLATKLFCCCLTKRLSNN